MQERLLTSALGARAHYVCLGSLDAGLSSSDLSICLIDSCRCSLDLGILKVALAVIVLDGGFCGLNCGSSLSHLSFIIVVFELCDEIALVYSLIIGDLHIADDASNFRAERGQVATHVRVVGHLIDLPAFPRVPFPGDRGHNSASQEKYEERSHILLPFGFC